jgi:hypothetical protein
MGICQLSCSTRTRRKRVVPFVGIGTRKELVPGVATRLVCRVVKGPFAKAPCCRAYSFPATLDHRTWTPVATGWMPTKSKRELGSFGFRPAMNCCSRVIPLCVGSEFGSELAGRPYWASQRTKVCGAETARSTRSIRPRSAEPNVKVPKAVQGQNDVGAYVAAGGAVQLQRIG